MIKAIGLLAAAVLLSLTPGIASAAPAHPDRWVLHEAARMGCVVEHPERVPMGPPNQGVTCDAHGQRFQVLYYRRMGDAVAWWRHWVRGGWIARDGLVLVVPVGATATGVDSGAYRHAWADYAAQRLRGRVLTA